MSSSECGFVVLVWCCSCGEDPFVVVCVLMAVQSALALTRFVGDSDRTNLSEIVL